MPCKFWENIKELLKEQDKQDIWLTKEANISRSTIVNGIRGQHAPSVEIAYRCAKALGVTVEEALTGIKDKKKLSREEENLLSKWEHIGDEGRFEMNAMLDVKLSVLRKKKEPVDVPLDKKAAGQHP